MNINLVSLLEDLNMQKEAIEAAVKQLSILQDDTFGGEQKEMALYAAEWEYAPDSIDEMIHDCYYCSECDCYHEQWTGNGYLIQDGELHVTFWDCDINGNWDCCDSQIVKSTEEFEKITRIDWDRIQKQWENYYKAVIETTEDPLHLIPIKDKEYQYWMAYFKNTEKGVQVVATQNMETTQNPTLKGENIPKEILDFCCADENHIIDTDTAINVISLLEKIRLENEKTGVVSINTDAIQDGFLSVKIKLSMPRSEIQMKKDLIKKAQKNIKDKYLP